MPQINQLPEIYASQIFWLLLVFALIYFGIGKGMVSKIGATVDARDGKIADDLAAAGRARSEADTTEQQYRERMDAARAEAQQATQAAKASAAIDREARIKAADAELAITADQADARLKTAQAQALGQIEDVAAEAAQDIVARVSGLTVDRTEAARAARVALAAA